MEKRTEIIAGKVAEEFERRTWAAYDSADKATDLFKLIIQDRAKPVDFEEAERLIENFQEKATALLNDLKRIYG